MNKKQLLLGDYFEAGKNKSLNSKRSPTEQKLQQNILQNYLVVCDLVSKLDLQIDLDPDLENPCQKLTNIIEVIKHLVNRRSQDENDCEDCKNYEKHLQKLEADVRQHIRLQQQLKLYQDSIEEKNEQMKREKKSFEKQLDVLKKKSEDLKQVQQKLTRVEQQNEQLRNELKQLKNKNTEKPSSAQNQYRKFDSKVNLTEKLPLTRTINFSSNLNSNEQRKSIDKKHMEPRPDTEKYRLSLNNKSTSTLRPPTDRRRYEDRPLLKDKQNQRRRTNKVDIRK